MTRHTTLRFAGTLNPGQLAFIRSQAKWTAFLGGWGSGKTFIGARKAVELAALNPGCAGLIVAPFWNTVYRTTLAAFLKVVPRHLIRRWSRKERCVYLVGGRSVYYGSADRPETLDGATAAWSWIDEARYVKRDGWQVTASRLRDVNAKALRGIITSTPGGQWLREEFGGEKPASKRAAIHASTRENAGHLGEGYVESLESTLSARAARVFIEGHFGLLEGAVYEEFDPAWHLVPWRHDRGLKTVASVDFGARRPAVVFLQKVPPGRVLGPAVGGKPRVSLDNTWVAFDEIMADDLSTEALAALIRAKGYTLDALYCDPAGDGVQSSHGTTDVQVLRAALGVQPLFVTAPRLRYIRFGVGVLQAKFRNTLGETRLWFADSLRNTKGKRGLVKDVQAYHYPQERDGMPIKDDPVKDGLSDHSLDALRYWAINDATRTGQVSGSIPAL